MTPNETRILKFIWENNEAAPVFKIAKAEGLSTGYLRLICEKLMRDKFIALSDGQYKILDLGKMQLEDLGLIKKMRSIGPGPPISQEVLKKSIGRRKIVGAVKKKKTATKKEKKIKNQENKKTLLRQGFGGQAKKQENPSSRAKLTTGRGTENKKIEEAALAQLSISPKLRGALADKGFRTLESVATTAVSRLMETTKDLKLEEAARMINEARQKLKKEGKEYLWESP